MARRIKGDLDVARRIFGRLATNLAPWKTGGEYIANDLFLEGGNLFLVVAPYTAPATFDAKAVEIKQLSVASIGGQFAGAAATYAAAPTTIADGSAIDNGDFFILTDDDIGTGTAAAPQYKSGIYMYDGTDYQFAAEIADKVTEALRFKAAEDTADQNVLELVDGDGTAIAELDASRFDEMTPVTDAAALTTLAGTLTAVDRSHFAYQEDTKLVYVFDGTEFIPVSAPPYKQDFVVADWAVAADLATITVPVATHAKGITPASIQVFEGTKLVGLHDVDVSATGDITLTVTTGSEFDGYVVVA